MAVLYLTGAPASGKSTLSQHLSGLDPHLIVFSYSERLRDYISRTRTTAGITEDKIRSLSAAIVTPDDVDAVDEELLKLVAEFRRDRSIVIDSHPVTKETYGFRVTGFTIELLRRLNPDFIFCLFVENKETRHRIEMSAKGRPMPTEFEAGMHTFLQASVASQYAIACGCPLYLLNATATVEDLAKIILAKLAP